MHAGVSSDARAADTSEGHTFDMYQRLLAVIWQGANRFVASSSLLTQLMTFDLCTFKGSYLPLPDELSSSAIT